MTLQEIEKLNKPNLTIKEASQVMGVTPGFLQMGLQQGRFPFGTAVKMSTRWRYYINTERFIDYMTRLGKIRREQQCALREQKRMADEFRKTWNAWGVPKGG